MNKSLLPVALWLALVWPARATTLPEIPVSPPQRAALGITVATANAVTAAPVVAVPAIVRPAGDATHAVVAAYSGTVTRLLAQDGAAVRKGQPLLQLRSRDYAEQRAAAVAARAEAKALAAQLERDRKLLAEGIIARRRLDESEAASRAAEARAAQHGDIQQFLRAAPDAPGEYQLLAPVAGLLAETGLSVGQELEGGHVAFQVQRGTDVWLEAQLPEQWLERVAVGHRVVAGAPARAGRVIAVGRTVSAETRAVLLRAAIPTGPGLRPGQATELVVEAPVAAGTVIVPAAAVVRLQGAEVVFVASARGFQPVRVQTGMRTTAGIAVLAPGLAGRTVAVSGVAALKSLALAAGEGG